jgi:hypothetical protein
VHQLVNVVLLLALPPPPFSQVSQSERERERERERTAAGSRICMSDNECLDALTVRRIMAQEEREEGGGTQRAQRHNWFETTLMFCCSIVGIGSNLELVANVSGAQQKSALTQ